LISTDALLPILLNTKEGDMFTAGTLLKGLSDETIAWVVIEQVYEDDTASIRITLHAYWHDIFVASKVVRILNETELQWGVPKA
jgi:hypothetical protein